jgi:hypothetical protein
MRFPSRVTFTNRKRFARWMKIRADIVALEKETEGLLDEIVMESAK